MNEHGCLRIEIFNDPFYQENGLLLWCDGDDEAWIIDPGLPPQAEQFVASIRERGLKPSAIVLTHCHPDHIAGVGPLKAEYSEIPIIAPRAEADLLTDAEANMSAALGVPIVAPPADRLIEPGETLALGRLVWQVLDVSGHSPGGLAFYSSEAGVVLGGDALFNGSIGRYDFPNSSREDLLENIRNQLLTLPDETVLYSGHGPISTIGHEREHNAVLRAELGE